MSEVPFFVIVEPNLEYNDEIYFQQGSLETRKVYISQELAQADCDKSNFEMVHDHDNIGAYGYDISDLTSLSEETLSERLEAIGICFPEGISLSNLDTQQITMSNLNKFLSIFDRLPQSIVKEVPLEGNAHDLAALFAKSA